MLVHARDVGDMVTEGQVTGHRARPRGLAGVLTAALTVTFAVSPVRADTLDGILDRMDPETSGMTGRIPAANSDAASGRTASQLATCVANQALPAVRDETFRLMGEHGRALFGPNFRIQTRLSLSAIGSGPSGDIDSVIRFHSLAAEPSGGSGLRRSFFLQNGLTRRTDEHGTRRYGTRIGVVDTSSLWQSVDIGRRLEFTERQVSGTPDTVDNVIDGGQIPFPQDSADTGGRVVVQVTLPGPMSKDARVYVRLMPGDGDNPAVPGEDYGDSEMVTPCRETNPDPRPMIPINPGFGSQGLPPVYSPRNPPQASGLDASDVEVSGLDSITEVAVRNTGSGSVTFQTGQWFEPKDGGLQRMITTRTTSVPSGSTVKRARRLHAAGEGHTRGRRSILLPAQDGERCDPAMPGELPEIGRQSAILYLGLSELRYVRWRQGAGCRDHPHRQLQRRRQRRVPHFPVQQPVRPQHRFGVLVYQPGVAGRIQRVYHHGVRPDGLGAPRLRQLELLGGFRGHSPEPLPNRTASQGMGRRDRSPVRLHGVLRELRRKRARLQADVQLTRGIRGQEGRSVAPGLRGQNWRWKVSSPRVRL